MKIDREKLEKMYWKEEKSMCDIALELGVSTATIYMWMRKFQIPIRTRNESLRLAWKKKRKPYVIDVNLSPSEELGYVIGVLLGDGCLFTRRRKGDYIIRLDVTSRAFALSFFEALRKIGLNPSVKVKKKHHRTHFGNKPTYIVTAYSKKLYTWVRSLSLNQLRETLEKREMTIGFLRGFYESDGSLKNRGDLAFSNSNRELLELVAYLLSKLGINVNVTGPYIWSSNRKPMYLIQMGETKARKLLEIIQPCIKNYKTIV